jgi:hypothetical protein
LQDSIKRAAGGGAKALPSREGNGEEPAHHTLWDALTGPAAPQICMTMIKLFLTHQQNQSPWWPHRCSSSQKFQIELLVLQPPPPDIWAGRRIGAEANEFSHFCRHPVITQKKFLCKWMFIDSFAGISY